MDSTKMHKAMFEEANVGIFIVNKAGVIVEMNPYSAKLFGYKDKELLGEKVEALIPSSFRHKHVDHRDNYYKKPTPRSMGAGLELYGLRKDGSQFPIEISLSYSRIDGDLFAIAYVSDDSIQKNMLTKLRESKERLDEAQRLAHIGSFEMDLVTGVDIWSEEMFHIFGLDPEKGIINYEKYLTFIHPDDLALVKENHEKIKKEKKGINFGYRIISTNNGVRYVEGRRDVKLDEAGNVVKIFGMLQDVTERKENEKKLQEYSEHLEERIEERTQDLKASEAKLIIALDKEKELGELKSRFVSMASHEFRTPLSSILSSANLISRYEEEAQQDKRMKHVNRIESSVKNLTVILNDFLSLEKLESGKVRYHPIDLVFEDYIQQVIDEVNLTAKEGQEVVHSHKGNSIIKADEHLLKNILLNLLSNGIKYSANGENVELNTYCDDQQLKIEVKDFGIGIPESDQKHMFDRFFRATNVTAIQGTGLGLTIIKRYLDLMDGNISFHSKEGEGTTFTVIIPQKVK